MFPIARCFLPVHTQPRVVNLPCRRAPAHTAFSARARRGPRRDRSWDDDGGSGDEDAIDQSFFGEARDDEEEPDEPEEERRRRPASPEPAGQLRGSDVLRALQRAAAAKEAKKMVKKKQQQSAGARPAARRQGKQGGSGSVTPVKVVVGEVRPIEIRPEWLPRIRELELTVEQLLDKYHHHQ